MDRPPDAQVSHAWHALGAEQALERLGVGRDGLSSEEAAARRARFGPNAIEQARGPGPLKVLLRQFDNPIVYLLLGAAALALLLGKVIDGLVVLGAIVVNVVIGFLQEYRAGKAVAALSRMVPNQATALRDGRTALLPAAELVPGDIVTLASGDRVPADGRLLAARNLRVEEAALTGESVPADKSVEPVPEDASLGDRHDMVYGGTMVTTGTATVLVVATGVRSELGRISAMLGEATELETPLTRAMAAVGRWLTVAVLALSVLLMGVAVLRGYPAGDGLLVAITLAVATIPEGLPAIITIALAVGVQRMAARRGIVRRLPSVETLGSTTVICSDKTGTLTRNEMAVQALWTPHGAYRLSGIGYAPRGTLTRAHGTAPSEGTEAPLAETPPDVAELLLAGALCNDAALVGGDGPGRETWHITGDPTEGALVVAAEKAGLRVVALREAWTRRDAIPFESEHQYMATLHRGPEPGAHVLLKGAPEVVLPRCALPDGLSAADVLAEVERLAARGMRVLALARGRLGDRRELRVEDVEGGLRLLGLQGMIDPPRAEAIRAVAACYAAGIEVKMVTGDHAATAAAIGRELGLMAPGMEALTGNEIARLDDEQLRHAALQTNVFARVAPEHKLRLVRALQAEGNVVAMTGDGVNDAPALKQADIGVAMGITGTAVSKEAADVVLADDNFATLSAAVEEGRRIYDNLVKSLAFVLPTNLGLGFILTAAVLFFPIRVVDGVPTPLMPMLPTQLLWVNLVASVALSLPLAFEVSEPDVMTRPPQRPGSPILGRFVVWRTVLVAALMAGGAVGLFLWEYTRALPRFGHATALAEAQTMATTTVVFFQVFYLFNCRSLRDSVFAIGFFSNPVVFVGIAGLLALQAAFIYLPPLQAVFGTRALDLSALGLSALVASLVLPVVSLEKFFRSRGQERRNAVARKPRMRPVEGT